MAARRRQLLARACVALAYGAGAGRQHTRKNKARARHKGQELDAVKLTDALAEALEPALTVAADATPP